MALFPGRPDAQIDKQHVLMHLKNQVRSVIHAGAVKSFTFILTVTINSYQRTMVKIMGLHRDYQQP